MQHITFDYFSSFAATLTRRAPKRGRDARPLRFAKRVVPATLLAASLLAGAAFVAAGIALHARMWLPEASGAPGAAVDVLLLALFAIHHHLLQARAGRARWWPRVRPVTEFSAELLIAGLLLAVLYSCWQPLPAEVWSVDGRLPRTLLWTGWIAGWVWVALAVLVLAPAGRPGATATDRTETRALAQLVVGGVLVNFCTDTMTQGHLLFAMVTTAYLIARCARRVRPAGRVARA